MWNLNADGILHLPEINSKLIESKTKIYKTKIYKTNEDKWQRMQFGRYFKSFKKCAFIDDLTLHFERTFSAGNAIQIELRRARIIYG